MDWRVGEEGVGEECEMAVTLYTFGARGSPVSGMHHHAFIKSRLLQEGNIKSYAMLCYSM